jgi:hypothetical protein
VRDAAGNLGTAASAVVNIATPATPTVTAEVVDNFVLLRWNDCTASLPITRYEAYRDGVLIGDNGDGRFATVFEQAGGSITYGVKAYDSAGNAGSPGTVTATVSAPPDYVLRSEFAPTLASGTTVNGYVIDGKLLAPMYVETDAAHTTRIGYSTDSAASSAGLDRWWESGHTTGSWSSGTLDIGVLSDPSTVTVTPTIATVQGAVTVTYEIKASSTGAFAGEESTYTDAQSYVGVQFRYVRVKLTFTASGGDDLIEVSAVNIKVATKLRSEVGTVSVTANPTTVTTSGAIGTILSVALTPTGTAARFATYSYTSGANFDVCLFDHAGAAVTGTVGWAIGGV